MIIYEIVFKFLFVIKLFLKLQITAHCDKNIIFLCINISKTEGISTSQYQVFKKIKT